MASKAPAACSTQLDPRSRVTGSIGEEPGRVRRARPPGGGPRLDRQRGHLPHQLSLGVKRRAARGQDRHRGTAAQQHLGAAPGGTEDVLAAVQHHLGVCVAQMLRHRLQRRAAGSQANGFEHRVVDEAGVGQRGQFDEVDAPPPQVTGADPELKGQPGFADPADAHQGDEPLAVTQQRPKLVQLPLTANEAGQGHRQAAGDPYVLWLVGTGARCGVQRLAHQSIMARDLEQWARERSPRSGDDRSPARRQRWERGQ